MSYTIKSIDSNLTMRLKDQRYFRKVQWSDEMIDQLKEGLKDVIIDEFIQRNPGILHRLMQNIHSVPACDSYNNSIWATNESRLTTIQDEEGNDHIWYTNSRK